MTQRLPVLVFVFCLAACDNRGPMDAGVDSGSMDAGVDSGPVWVGPGCNATTGIQCDGDWEGRCNPGCAASECCSPQHAMAVASGSFTNFVCVPRGADGSCPAANVSIDASQIEGRAYVTWSYFAADDCAIAEGCVDAPGWRRLLRFGTWTPNTGTADLFLGTPPAPGTSSPPFVYSVCHDHHHFEGYANYEVRRSDGTVAATGHKQAFCLEDFYPYPCDRDGSNPDPMVPDCTMNRAYYTCGFQGIERGWQDVYDESLDCQWVDVTSVPDGNYTLHIDLNVNHDLLESNYSDNSVDVPVTVADPVAMNVTLDCPDERQGADRDCGWTLDTSNPTGMGMGIHACNFGDTVRVACSAACGASMGSCTGDTVLRVCEASAGTNCQGPTAILGFNDDSGCPTGTADWDHCSRTETFTCPMSNLIEVFTGSWDTLDPSTCTVAVETPVL
jgi:hypothetical protein